MSLSLYLFLHIQKFILTWHVNIVNDEKDSSLKDRLISIFKSVKMMLELVKKIPRLTYKIVTGMFKLIKLLTEEGNQMTKNVRPTGEGLGTVKPLKIS